MRKVDFLIIGAARSGTLSLHHMLRQHENVFLPVEPPEPNFFFKKSEYRKGIDYYHNRYFAGAEANKILGEKSTSYFYNSNKVAKRIFDYSRNMKLILLLRNPIERIISNYFFTLKNGIEIMDLDYAIQYEEQRKGNYIDKWKEIKPYDYIGRSKYYNELKEYLKYFGRDQILIILFDDFRKQPSKEVIRICNFLNISQSPKIDYKQLNKGNYDIRISEKTLEKLKLKLYEDVYKLAELLEVDVVNMWKMN
ncbi:MAG: sulfotransferase domain-containing protein [Ignavibacteria bacterium]|nr:sulfotransferase domain-containing protein [Ignavibacteria bacterium]